MSSSLLSLACVGEHGGHGGQEEHCLRQLVTGDMLRASVAVMKQMGLNVDKMGNRLRETLA
jgi:hypothetical protein